MFGALKQAETREELPRQPPLVVSGESESPQIERLRREAEEDRKFLCEVLQKVRASSQNTFLSFQERLQEVFGKRL